MHRLVSVFSVVLMALVFNAAHPAAQTNERLGSVTFPISCLADPQKPFERAVSLLHSFVYEEAQPQFEGIFKKDPHCAIALWGEAMSIYYPLWFQPNAETIQRGQELIQQAQNVGAKTEHERGYIDARWRPSTRDPTQTTRLEQTHTHMLMP
jgi:hypothetical protein